MNNATCFKNYVLDLVKIGNPIATKYTDGKKFSKFRED
jgi:hypothetical protein